MLPEVRYLRSPEEERAEGKGKQEVRGAMILIRNLICIIKGHDWQLHLPARIVDGVYFPPAVFCRRCGQPSKSNYAVEVLREWD